MNSNYSDMPIITSKEITNSLNRCTEQVKRNLEKYTYHYQAAASENGFYPAIENADWTTGFWTGEIWLSYEHTNDNTFKYAALIQVEDFLKRIKERKNVDHHDMGFLYSLSCVSAYKLTGDTNAKTAAILAADNLISRYHEKGEFIQAWGNMNSSDNYRFIIDCLLNLPLLYWASEATGDEKYDTIALKHITTCLKNIIRPDNSTYHTFFMDIETGKPSHGATCQGYKNDSAWTRGQAWGIYGTALSYRYTKNPEYIETFRKITEFYLSKLPKDMVPFWDLTFNEGTDEPRDSSSAAIVACGLLEMSKYLPEDEAEYYTKLAKQMVKSLADHYEVKDISKSNGLLLHGTYSKKTEFNTCTHCGVDECVSWGDYFFMEALTRLNKDWQLYW